MKFRFSIKKIIYRILLGIISLSIIFYFSLWIYAINSVPKELKLKYNENIESYFNNEQYKLISFSINDNEKYLFKWYPFIIDFFVMVNSIKNGREINYNSIPSITASAIALEYYHRNLEKYNTMDWHIMNYGLTRYVIFQNDYKKCIDIIFNKANMGEGIFGINNASEYYFNKSIKDITDEELVSLIVLFNNPSRYRINTDENKERTLRILNNFM